MEDMCTNCNVQNNNGLSPLQDLREVVLLFVDYA